MAEIIRMPEVLAGATEGAIQTWLVSPGATVALDQAIAEIETDKATVELTAELDGVVGRLLAEEGDNVSVGDAILVLLAEGEDSAAIDAALAAAGVEATGGESPIEPAADSAPSPDETAPGGAPSDSDHAVAGEATSGRRRLFASPLVRRLASEHEVDLTEVSGTGPNGRVVKRDLDRHLEEIEHRSTPAVPDAAAVASTPTRRPAVQPIDTPAFEDVPLDRMRRAIARRLTESKTTVPHFYLVADCRVDALIALRTQINEGAARKISINDFVLKAVAAAHVEVPRANAVWNEESIRQFSAVDISVAVATEGGLMTPVLRGVEKLSLSQVGSTVADLAERARTGRLKQHEIEGGSFSVSNLGMYGTSRFSAILNPPQSGILAVGAARPAPVIGADGALTAGTLMTVTLSADHRVLDGAVAAEWLAAFQRLIENPLTILI